MRSISKSSTGQCPKHGDRPHAVFYFGEWFVRPKVSLKSEELVADVRETLLVMKERGIDLSEKMADERARAIAQLVLSRLL